MEKVSVRAQLVNKLLIVAVAILISFIISLQIAGVNFEQQTMMAIFIFALATSGALFYLHQTLDVLAAKLDLVESSLPYLKDNDQYGFDNLNQDAYPAFFRNVSHLFTIEVEAPEEVEPDKLDVSKLKALDVCQGNVMMADADCNITYVNTSVTTMLQKNEAALRTLLPNFNVATLVGTNVDVFHKNPSHQRSLLQSLTQPYSTKLELGDLTFSLIASPLFDEKGKRLGTVVEWADLSESLAAEKLAEEIANANQRTTSALDVCQANVMMADVDYNIVYVNEAVTAMLSKNEQQLRSVLPSFNVIGLIGTNIDTFHVNPAHQRGMLDNLKSTYRTDLELAGFTFGLIATPVFNDANERIGTVVEWEDKTARLAAERKAEEVANVNARTANALQVCQANVMMADADLNIVYVNDAVKGMLRGRERELQALLPNFSVDKLIGTCVDDFHKNPAHQRGMLDKLRDVYQTDLNLGEMTFGLIATPVFNEDGERVGTVVEWEDKTERLAAEIVAEDTANANKRTTSALDVCQANVMMADADYNIVYVNEAVVEMLKTNEQQLRTALPQFNVASLIGTNIDTFHVNPAHQRGMLDNLKSTYKTDLELAGFTFGLIATPVFSDDGERLGTVVEWEDKTERLAAEREAAEIANVNARTANALQVCQANVMMADADLNIVYVNDAVKGMLRGRERELQALLPNFSVDKLIGTCVDDFHKNPAHQRGMLDKLRDVYQTDLNLGEMTFGLIATPVFNEDGERVGTVVEWEDKTERLAAEKVAQEIANANSRTTSALDVCQANIMMADVDYNIVYVNEAVVTMLSANEQQLRTVLPKFDVASLIGTNIDTFHKNPAHQRGMLDKLASTYKTDLELAGFTFGLIATPVFNDDGERLGTVVEWDDKTERLAAERAERAEAAENLRIKQALDNVSANAMIADAGNNIVFMNEAVQSMMRDAEADIRTDLPNFNSNNLVGQNVDVFHKNPAHQQNMLKSLASTYKTEIVVGGRTFSLIANPINSDDGERVGTVVEWNDRTAEVAIEKEIDNLIASAGGGELDVRLEEGDKSGFFLNLTKGLNSLVEIVDDAVAETGNMLDAMAHGDLTKRIDKDYQGSFDKLKRDANTTAEKLTEVIDQINTSATLVASGAEEISQGNADLSQRTEEQASSLEETASSMEEMTSTVRQNADNAKVANELAANTQDQAAQGGQVVQRAVTSMAEINDSSKKISDIIGVIDEIAFQTNLLALNAAVEAARAGEQGRGFAVVAGEVRNLAQRSAAAAKEIKELIRDSVSKVEDGTLLVNESGTTLQKIVLSVQKVTEMIADITVASEEQSSGIEQVNKAITQMDEMTQQNAALVEEASAAGESMAEQANGMRQLLTFFKSNAGGHAAALPAPTSHKPIQKPAAPRSSRAQRLASPSTGDDFVDSSDEWEEF